MTQIMTCEESQDTVLASNSGRVRRHLNWKWTEGPYLLALLVFRLRIMGFISGRLASLCGQKAAEIENCEDGVGIGLFVLS